MICIAYHRIGCIGDRYQVVKYQRPTYCQTSQYHPDTDIVTNQPQSSLPPRARFQIPEMFFYIVIVRAIYVTVSINANASFLPLHFYFLRPLFNDSFEASCSLFSFPFCPFKTSRLETITPSSYAGIFSVIIITVPPFSHSHELK